MLTVITVIAALSVFVTLSAHWAVLHKLRQATPLSLSRDGPFEGVTILKPLKGQDDELYENLTAFARLDYPRYEVLFGAEDPDDPALWVARRVQQENPNTAIRILCGADLLALNPKVRVLSFLAPYARYDWILVSDSNVRPDRSYLMAVMACQAQTGAALVHNVLGGDGERSVGATLENLQMNTWVAGAVCLADAAGHPCVIGKSMLMRRSELATLGGFAAVRDVLAEDYVLGRMYARAGHRVELSPHVLPTFNSERSVGSYLGRHVRWGQLRRRLSPAGFVGELLFNPTPWLGLLAVLGSAGTQLIASCCLLLKLIGDALLARGLRGRSARPRQLLWIPVKDLLTLGMWLVSAFRNRVSWRGNQLWIGAGTQAVPVTARGVERGGTSRPSSSPSRRAPSTSSTIRYRPNLGIRM